MRSSAAPAYGCATSGQAGAKHEKALSLRCNNGLILAIDYTVRDFTQICSCLRECCTRPGSVILTTARSSTSISTRSSLRLAESSSGEAE